MTTDAQALAIALRALPTESRAALHFALAVGRAESHYADGWDAAGQGSNNWGSVQATSDAQPSFPHLDHHADGTPYTGHYRIYPTPEAGFKDLAFNVLKPNVREAAERADGTAAVFAMHGNGYFELAPAKYAAAVEAQYNGFLKGTAEPRLINFGPMPADGPTQSASGSVDLIDIAVGLTVALGAAWLADVLPVPAKGKPR